MRFEGRYYKHQRGNNTLCLIEGVADDGRFLQVIVDGKVYHFTEYDGCSFSNKGVVLRLPNITGEIRYTDLTPLKSDIMGWFRFLPLQCRHSVVSMLHRLEGGVEVDGQYINFTGGRGYIEGDSGRSFPRQYLWLHSNAFAERCSIMASVAHIPLLCLSFTGIICAIVYNGEEYRLATYHGAKVVERSVNRLVIAQKNLRLEVDIFGSDFVPLKMPVRGKMIATVHECNTAQARFKLFDGSSLVFELTSPATSFEYHY